MMARHAPLEDTDMSEEDTKRLATSAADVVTYPILTREIDSDLGGPSRAGALNGGALNHTAQQTLRDLLGWRYRSEDAAGFTAALSKAFTARQVDGYTHWDWKPQSFSLQADLGAVTGAQASIHAQARTTIDQVLPLLDALEPLRVDVDKEDSEAIRSIVRASLREIVDELALKSGPRVQRVDLYFEGMLGDAGSGDGKSVDADSVDGQLGQLRERFGLLAERVNTVDEERNLTNFIVIVDQLHSLRQAWLARRGFFSRNLYSVRQPFLGTQLVQLAEILDVIVEQVQECCAGMDSVFFGAAERQATLLRLPPHPPITVAELMSWIESFATGEGRRLLQDSGKDGVVAFHDTIEPLARLARAAVVAASGDVGEGSKWSAPAAFRTRRVAVLLDCLALHLETAAQRAGEIQLSERMPHFVFEWALSPRKDGYLVRRWPVQGLCAAEEQIVRVDESREQIVQAALVDCNDRIVKEADDVRHGRDPVFDLRGKDWGLYDLLLEFGTGRIVRVRKAVQVHKHPDAAGSGGKKD